MMPSIDVNGEESTSWMDTYMNTSNSSMDLVDVILLQSLKTSSNVEDVLNTVMDTSTCLEPTLDRTSVSNDEIEDFLLEFEATEQQDLSVSRTMFDPTPLSEMKQPLLVVPQEENMSSFGVPNVNYSFVQNHNTLKSESSEDDAHSSASRTSDVNGAFLPLQVKNEDENQSQKECYCPKFRGYQCDQWQNRYAELLQFVEKHGHSSVPCTDSSNSRLVRWVKRQRYQYKLRQKGEPSAMTDERIEALNRLEFVWDSYGVAWEDRLKELEEFKEKHKHCNVPSNYRENSSLANWIKCQRRQYRLYREGKKSNITQARIDQLERMGFQFNLRVGYNHQNHHRNSNGWS